LIRSSGAGAQELGPQDGLVQAELTVQFLCRGRLRVEGDDGVDALVLLLDLVGQTAFAPQVDVVQGAAVFGDDGQELVELGLNGAFLEIGVEDDHEFVLTHADNPPPSV
jgi:hypothetical protein